MIFVSFLVILFLFFFLPMLPRIMVFFFSSKSRHTRSKRDWSSDVCSSDLGSTARRSPAARAASPARVTSAWSPRARRSSSATCGSANCLEDGVRIPDPKFQIPDHDIRGVWCREFLLSHGEATGDTVRIRDPKSQIPYNDFYDFWNLESGIWNMEAGIWNLESGIWNLESGIWNLESGIWNLESGIWNLESGIWNLESLLSHICIEAA